MADPFIAEIKLFGGNFAPRGWALCEGQLLPISQNSALFSLLGTIYGGDGRTTFALPDLRGRVPIQHGRGPGLSTYNIGQRGGVETVTLNTNQIPAHSHIAAATTTANMRAESRPGNRSDPTGLMLASGTNIFRRNAPVEDVLMDSDMLDVSVDVQIGDTGGNLSHTNVQPYLALNFIIALVGVFPSRS